MTINGLKEKFAKLDKRIFLQIFCILLYILGLFFFIVNDTGRKILNFIAYVAYLVCSFAGVIFLYSYLRTYFGLDKKKEEEKVSLNREINYDLDSIDDGEYGAPYSFVEETESKQDSE